MSGFWVFMLDPKNFLALVGLVSLLRRTFRLARWLYRRSKPVPDRRGRAVNLNEN